MKERFTIPKLCKGSKLWYVHFRYDGKQFRETMGLNKIKDLEKREKEFNELARLLLVELRAGRNPNIPDVYQNMNKMNVEEAIDYALNIKKGIISKRTLTDYTSITNFFKEAAKELHLHHIAIKDLKRIHVKSILERIKKKRTWSNKAFNKNLGYIKAILSELVNNDIIEHNPAYRIKTLKVGEINANTTATDDEIEKIKNKLLNEFPNFYVFITTIYHTGIRPEELLKITISMVDLENNKFVMPPEITKTDIGRIVPINGFLKEFLSEMNIEQFDKDFYLFGSNREFSNRGLKKDLDFIPGKNKLNRDCASKLWRKLIKDDLGINVNMYSMKHLGANKKILAGIDLDTLRELYGHTSKMMTLRYAKVVKEVYRKQIIDLSPDFK